jgi:plastocyanin
MTVRFVPVLLAALLPAGSGVLAAQTPPASPAPSASPGASASPAPVPSPDAVVRIKAFEFHPASVTIHAGQTVQFLNNDDEPHTISASDGSFESGGLETNESYSRTFDTPGTYPYVCSLHPYMKGVVVVTPTTGGAGAHR